MTASAATRPCLLRALVAPLLVALALLFGALPLAAQDTTFVNYAGWERDAARAESILSEGRATNLSLEQLRAQISDWRKKFTDAQQTNSTRIETLRSQIAALGPLPAEGQTEGAQVAARRGELNDQLTQLQAPGIAASEALGRAEGIIKEIDRVIRERQADALLRLSPTPLNPVNWPAGFAVLSQGLKTLGAEFATAWDTPERRTELRNNLPVILLYLFLAGLLMMKGPGFMERLTERLYRVSLFRTRNIAAAIVSLGQVAVPVLGTILLVAATQSSGMTGLRSGALFLALPVAAFAFFAARWLANLLFPPDRADDVLALTDRPLEGRFHTAMIGFVYGFEMFRIAFTTEVRPPLSMAAQAVWAAPLVCVVAIFVFRLGMLLRRKTAEQITGAEGQFRSGLIRLIGTAAVGVSVLAPLLAVIGYVAAANALMWPAVLSLAMIGLLILLQRFATDIFLAVTRKTEAVADALFPVLAGFVLTLAALPVFALIWGARKSDLADLWSNFLGGVTIGQTRISPTAFLMFALVFAFGYMVTRVVQGALKSSVLPRTRLDKGAQNAAAAGIGYIGIFLAALAAINAAGIDLSSLAIVAGALSVGIGFGLQNIVQNFVSGIILLIERPISEGDMIEVGNKTGIVKAISVRSTRIQTFDRSDLIVPNADLISGVVTNWTRSDAVARLIVSVGVAYGSDTRRVAAILREIADAQPAVLIDPPPAVVFTGFGPDSLAFEVRMLMSDLNVRGDLQTEINHQIAERFAAEGIEIPFAQRDIWIRNAEELRAPPRQPDAAAKLPATGTEPKSVAMPELIRNDPNEGEDPERT